MVGKMAKLKDATPAQIAIAWVLAQKTLIVPIPGTIKLHRIKENIGGASSNIMPVIRKSFIQKTNSL